MDRNRRDLLAAYGAGLWVLIVMVTGAGILAGPGIRLPVWGVLGVFAGILLAAVIPPALLLAHDDKTRRPQC